ncbi:MAG: hypothetical protein ACK2U1_24865 [Anaerolineales bacterium]
MMKVFSRLGPILTKIISILVIILCIALISVIWIIQDDISSGINAIFTEVDNLAQVMRNGIATVEPGLASLSDLIGQVETSTEEIAQNVSDEGLILRLLPLSVVDDLESSSQSLKDNFNAVYDLLEAASDMLLALDKLPIIDMPEKGLSIITSLQESMENLSDRVDSLKTSIVEIRTGMGERISRVSDFAALLGSEADQFHSNLIEIDTDLDTIQTKVRNYQRLSTPLIITTVILISLLSAWVIYTQIVMFSRSTIPEREKVIDITENQSRTKHEKDHS